MRNTLAQSYPGSLRAQPARSVTILYSFSFKLVSTSECFFFFFFTEIVISNLIHAHIHPSEGDCVSWSIINGCLSGPLKCSIVLHSSREVFVYWRSLHSLRHTSLLVKRHSICPYLLFTVNQWVETSSQESVFAVACRGKWARILDALLNSEPISCTVCQAFFLLVKWRPGQLKCKNLLSER